MTQPATAGDEPRCEDNARGSFEPLGALDVSRQQLPRRIIFRRVRHRPCWARQSRPVEPRRTRHTACRAPTRPCTRLVDHTASRACWRRYPATAMTLARTPAKRCKVAVLPQRPTRAGFRGPASSAIRPMHDTETNIALEQLLFYDGDALIFDGSDPSTYTVCETPRSSRCAWRSPSRRP